MVCSLVITLLMMFVTRCSMANSDLFTWLRAIWTKEKPEGTFPYFVAHRFLASDRGLAEAARVLWRDIRDPAMIFATWQGLLPHANDAPRLSYPAPKKGPDAEVLTLRMMSVLGESRRTVESMIDIITMQGAVAKLYAEFGIQNPDEPKAKVVKAKPVESKPQGLFGMIK